MKYAESPGVASTVLIDAPPEKVWALVSDPMTPARFENELVKAEWENAPNGAELGATFRGFNHHPDLGWSWEVVCVINRYEEGRLFGWSAGDVESAAAQWSGSITTRPPTHVLAAEHVSGSAKPRRQISPAVQLTSTTVCESWSE